MRRPRTRALGSARALFASRAAYLLVPVGLCCGDGRLNAFLEPDESVPEMEPVAPPSASAMPGSVPAPEDVPPNDGPHDPAPSFWRDPPDPAEPTPEPKAGESLLIDDLEDGDTELAQPLEGSWYAFQDNTGSQHFDVEQPDEERAGSHYSLHFAGGGFQEWGAGVGAPLRGSAPAEPEPAPLDAAAYDAVAFQARADQNSERRLHLQLHNPDRDDDLQTERFETKVTLSNEWERYVVRFDELEWVGDVTHLPQTLDPASLTALQFYFPNSDEFDVWLDDITFVIDCPYCETNLHHMSSEPPPETAEGAPLGH